jgi:Fur family transcriptional regulator, ferric uptake regulator
MNRSDQILQDIVANGFSNTFARRKIVAAFLENDLLSIAELTKICNGIDRTSIYRNIDTLLVCGIIQRINFGWKIKYELGEKYSSHHHHLICRKCGESTHLGEEEKLELYLSKIASRADFVMESHHIELVGLCSSCAKIKT